MAATYPGSWVPQVGATGPLVGEKLTFFEAGTTTPMPVYSDGSLSTVIDQPVLSDASGFFEVIYLDPSFGDYRVKQTDTTGAVTRFDRDDISIPRDADFVDPDAGETSPELLATTGDIKLFYGTAAPTGYVRGAGRTIGNAASGATERANADCEDLFEHLWTVDDNLTVSGGRGASAAADWAANKTIALPDFRERVPAGLATMGNTDAGRIADTLLDADDSSTLGATGGADDVVLTAGQLASHTHTGSGTTASDGAHTHTFAIGGNDSPSSIAADGASPTTGNPSTSSAGAHTHTFSFTSDASGSGQAHPNLQPTIFVLVCIKL